jgi:hypothetical protein
MRYHYEFRAYSSIPGIFFLIIAATNDLLPFESGIKCPSVNASQIPRVPVISSRIDFVYIAYFYVLNKAFMIVLMMSVNSCTKRNLLHKCRP